MLDGINYNVTRSGPYSSISSIARGEGFDANDRYIYVDGDAYANDTGKCVWNIEQNAYVLVHSQEDAIKCVQVNFNALVSVPHTDHSKIKPILYVYVYPNHEMREMSPERASSTLRDWAYLAKIVVPINTTLRFHSSFYDPPSKTYVNSAEHTLILNNFTLSRVQPNTIFVRPFFSNIALSNQSADMQIGLFGLINTTFFAQGSAGTKNVWKTENLNLQVMDADYRTLTYVSGSFHMNQGCCS
jgi:hypothetical protein